VQGERVKIKPSKKRLSSHRRQFFPFMRRNGDEVMVISVHGYLDREDCERIFEICEQNLEKGISNFIVDFSQVHHIHYNDVGILVKKRKGIERKSGEIKFVVGRPYLLDILFFGGWPFYDDVYPSSECALRAFKEESAFLRRKDVHGSYTGYARRNS
jgi:anti-anti-sigma regulatory factor